MARREVKKKPSKRNPLAPKRVLEKDGQVKELEVEKQEEEFTDPDVERQIAAIRAIRDVEIERLRTEIRLLRSYFNKEQCQTQVLKFFADNFPGLSVVKTGPNGRIEIQFETERDKGPKEITRDSHISFLHRLSMARSEFSAPFSSFGGFEFSTKAAKTRLQAPDLQIGPFVLDEPHDSRMVGIQDAFQTPGISNQRLSVGMTPKTLRLPKPGEMLLSVRGSPLGVYKEDNMEAICESEER